jgi:hypothetical protein
MIRIICRMIRRIDWEVVADIVGTVVSFVFALVLCATAWAVLKLL